MEISSVSDKSFSITQSEQAGKNRRDEIKQMETNAERATDYKLSISKKAEERLAAEKSHNAASLAEKSRDQEQAERTRIENNAKTNQTNSYSKVLSS